MLTQDEPEVSTDKNMRRALWFTFLVSLAGSAFLISVLVDSKLDFFTWHDWFLVGGTIWCLFFTVYSGLSLVIDIDSVIERLFDLLNLLDAPILVIGGVLVLVSVFIWLSSIPSWAAVIISLLVLLLLRR